MRRNGYSTGRDSGNKSAAPRKGGNSLWVGIFAGSVIGVGLAAVVAWYLMKSPSPFTNKEQRALPSPLPEASIKAAPATPEKSTASNDGKPRFEFYKVLTDKQNTTAVTPSKPTDKPKPLDKPKLVASYEPQILQAGSFSTINDAEKLKAKLALLGLEANVQTATIPDKGVWYRVRLGPYNSESEINQVRSFLKQNGVDSTPMRAQ